VSELVVLVGLQASGKSTFTASRFAGTHTVVSKDLMRSARYKEARQQREVAEALSAGRDVVVDNTNPGPEQRAALIGLAREHGARPVAYYFPPDKAACLARNAARQGRERVPDIGVLATLRALRKPTRAEGFDAVYVVELAGEGRFTVTEDKTGS
jgi:predicted kinase